MKLPELVSRRAEKTLAAYCRSRKRFFPGGELRGLTFRLVENTATLFATCACSHPPGDDLPVARLRYDFQLRQWTLHYHDRGHWRFYLNAAPTLDLSRLLRHLDEDPLRVFWV